MKELDKLWPPPSANAEGRRLRGRVAHLPLVVVSELHSNFRQDALGLSKQRVTRHSWRATGEERRHLVPIHRLNHRQHITALLPHACDAEPVNKQSNSYIRDRSPPYTRFSFMHRMSPDDSHTSHTKRREKRRRQGDNLSRPRRSTALDE